ncbi:MAG: SynChlorMet cassette radical SAM/SPASM protein ScmE [Victivallaceae bacterium]|nr:SynChlorMet cassette radical SAM/SPASM protein ScmE [Victivallaceae bacterium]
MKLERTPKSIDLNITTKCNLRCSYCSHFSSAGETDKDLPTEEWLKFFKELKECAVLDVCLSGGEALVRKDIRELIDGIIENRMRFSILSNGILIDDDTASFIKATGRCDSVQVSIDGPGPESHDISRGKGSFEKALSGLRTLIRHEIPATVRVTINKHNYKVLDEVSKLLLEDVGLPSFSTNAASHLGLCRDNADETQLNAEEYAWCVEKLFKLEKKYNGRINAQAGPLASGKHWVEMEKAKAAGLPEIPGRGLLTSCGGVYSKMAVLADGTMVPCSQLPHMNLGRINQDSLADIWLNHPELKRLRDRRDIPLKEFDFCEGCEYIPYCRGGCPALAYTLGGDENIPSPDACYRTFLEAGGKLPKLNN